MAANFWIIVVLGAGISDLAMGQAGSIASSVEKSVARRLAQRGEQAALSATERATLAKIWRETDQKTLAAIERRYGSRIGTERLGQAKRTPATITSRAVFDKHLREKVPGMTEAERQSVLGYYFDQRMIINGNHVQVPLTVAHERLHQLTHPRFRDTFGKDLDEGLTEHLARRIHGDLGIASAAKVYPNEQRVVSMLEARVGEERLASAYFRGDIASLSRYVDADLGKGSFQKLTQALRKHDLRSAEVLLR
jgi:hypothetical protein